MAVKFFTSMGRQILQTVAMRPDFREDSEWEDPVAAGLMVASVAAVFGQPFGATPGEFNKGVIKCLAVSRPPGVPPRRITDFHPTALALKYSKMMVETANFHMGLNHDVKRAGILSMEVKGKKIVIKTFKKYRTGSKRIRISQCDATSWNPCIITMHKHRNYTQSLDDI